MKSILKYKLDEHSCLSSEGDTLEIPRNSEVLDVQYQNDMLVMWCLVDLDYENDKEKRIFEIYGTGHILKEENYKYIKTLQRQNGLVWHIFEKI